jgi:hypothetical protein
MALDETILMVLFGIVLLIFMIDIILRLMDEHLMEAINSRRGERGDDRFHQDTDEYESSEDDSVV